jgi:GT2 family glycosyltransferase/glycosyltransferase involved in cell wall biosynthesis
MVVRRNAPAPAVPDLLDRAMAGCGAPRSVAVADAFARAGPLLKAGHTAAALATLEYAQRLAPSDGGISLAIGVLRLTLGEPRASEPLEMLTRRSDWQDIRLALVRVRLRFGAIEQAALDLHAALSRNGLPHRKADLDLASTVSARLGALGWCALTNAGRLVVGADAAAAKDGAPGLDILLDDTPIPLDGMRRSGGLLHIRLPPHWPGARRLDVRLHGRKLIGSPLDIARIARVEGFVEALPVTGALHGWCWFPAERMRAPIITIAALGDPDRAITAPARLADASFVRGDEFGIPHRFTADAAAIAGLGEAVTVTGPHGRALYGSPLWPGATRAAARTAMLAVSRLFPAPGAAPAPPAEALPREIGAAVAVSLPPRASPSPRARAGRPPAPRLPALRSPAPRSPVAIVIPVYTGRETTLACIDSVLTRAAPGQRLIVVADASPDRDLMAALAALAARGQITLRVETLNRGFPATANIGLRMAGGSDAVLLNADTVVTPGWLDGLRDAVHAAPDIGTATPLSNDATIFSYPRRDHANPMPSAADGAALAAHAAEANRGATVEVPTGHGFCLYIRAACLQETGLLREDLFAQGYGEENDLCMRARHLGWRHVAVPSVFVAHHGSQSFSGARDDLMRRNLETLNRLHVGYEAMIARWQRDDPLGPARRQLDLARLRSARADRDSVLLITHDRGGGIRQYVTARAAALARAGRQVLVLRPDNDKTADGRITAHAVTLDTGFDNAYPNLRFRLPQEQAALQACLQDCAVRAVEVNSLVGHAAELVDLVLAQKLPFDVVIHDYSWFCPRITLTTGEHRYCGEPPIAQCRDCVATHGTNLDEDISPDALVARSRRLLGAAAAVVAPSRDAARRIGAHFGANATLAIWETPPAVAPRPVSLAAGRVRPVRVCVAGAIGQEKGYTTLLRCARLVAETGAPVEFVVVGHTRDDRRLLETGAVRITGRYDEAEAVALIAAQNADLGWLPSVWPETWSYALTRLWDAGLFVVVHDIGAPAERVRAGGAGAVVPLHMPPDRLVALFRDPGVFRPRPAAAPLRAPALLHAP